ncbi:hypothetical protein FGE12_10045 [Aggregicoccus sp. 17bor-14]|uniref:hypothetical protein n=1 Tax=Myxococcaceae TaxID=31 RepID=UPI00129CE6C7|nr:MULTISPECIES: hypothetical protein [Myxococcaceae]MBF5042741.1 hypothetical protein [Simulacricoccus sp. 17bor-14]MRI88509.1 hypothetical protein [Aggregicoccus sp. 17bor-14]
MPKAPAKKPRAPTKDVSELTPDDLRAFPVWEFTNEESDGDSETMMRAVQKLPVTHLDGRIVATEVTLANGTRVFATLSNVSVKSPRQTQQFIMLSVPRDGRTFHLARYFDFDAAERGPAALARFLKLKPKEIFPIAYDLRSVCKARSAALVGRIEQKPPERLSDGERMDLLFE